MGHGSHQTEIREPGSNEDVPDYQREQPLPEAYERADGNVSQAAEEFSAARTTVLNWLEHHDIHTTADPLENSLAAQLEASDSDDLIDLERRA